MSLPYSEKDEKHLGYDGDQPTVSVIPAGDLEAGDIQDDRVDVNTRLC